MFKNFKLTAKLMISIGLVVLASFSITVSFITFNATDLSKAQALERMDTMSREFSNEITSNIDNAFSTARTLSYATQNMKLKERIIDREILLTMIEGILENHPGFLGIWMVLEPNAFDGADNKYKGATGHTAEGRFVPYWNRVGGVHLEACVELEGEWYTKARDSKKEVIMDPFSYEVSGKQVMMVSVCVPIIVNGKSIGVSGVDFSMDQIMNLVSGIKPYDIGYGVLATNSGMIAAHPDKEKIGKQTKDSYPDEIVQAARQDATSHLETTLETTNEASVITITPVVTGKTQIQWSLLVNAPLEGMLSGVTKMRNTSILISAVSLFLLGVLIFFMARIVIIRPINLVVESLTDISEGEGDLTKRLEVVSGDELGLLSNIFNTFIEKLQQMMKEISSGITTLSSSSTELSSISDQMSGSTNQTSEKSSAVASAAEEMTTNMASISAAMEQSSVNTNSVATAVEEMHSTINEIAENAEKARGISSHAVSKVNDSTQTMNDLRDAANAIGQVVETITDISEQVNLLSLNATIEAARAGEAGKGFAVVANEIKDLAGQTSEASMDIKEKIEHIQDRSESTMEGISQISNVINNVNDTVVTIATAVEEQSASTREIAENITQVSSGIQEVNENVNQSSTVATEIAQDISHVNQSAIDIAERSDQVKLSAQELSKLAEELNRMVGKFKV